MAKVAIVRNPVSGRSRLSRTWPAILDRLREIYGEVDYFETRGPSDATTLARQATSSGKQIVIAVGGDGTVTQVANGLMGSDVALGVIPSGTGNDLCRTLGVGSSVDAALDVLAKGAIRQMDVGKWTTDRSEGYFLNIAGMGFDAAVADRINRGFKTLRGTSAYLAAMAVTLFRYRAKPLKIHIGEEVIQEEVMLCAIANARCYGGGMMVAPMASVFDGRLEVVLVRKIGVFGFLAAFPRVFKGAHMSHPAVSHYQGTRVRLSPEGEVPFLIDGELTPCKWAEIEIVPAALKIVAA